MSRRRVSEYVRNFFSNLEQPGMPARVKWSKFVRNRARASLLLKGCCGHPGEPGC